MKRAMKGLEQSIEFEGAKLRAITHLKECESESLLDIQRLNAKPSSESSCILDKVIDFKDLDPMIFSLPPPVKPVPSKGIFFDIAHNYIQFKTGTTQQSTNTESQQNPEKKKGLLGSWFG
jgi:hypothetical protein